MDTIDSERSPSASPAPDTAGARLRAARESAGLSIEAVAQQLKLAPRQVRALEDDDFQRLPGRTFVRGFARNYARFLQLDPDTVVGLLPPSESAPALSRPSLAAARRPMGEMPVEGAPRQSAVRWFFPVLMVVVVAAAAYYEYLRENGRDPLSRTSTPVATDARSSAASSSASGAAGTSTTALPNPVTSMTPKAAEQKDAVASPAPATSGSSPASTLAASPAPASTTAPESTTPNAAEASTSTTASSNVPGRTSSQPGGAGTGEAALILAFKGTSWAEVKDAGGRVILQMTGGPGMTQTVTGTPPFELSLGNAPEVAVTFRGQSLDLAPYTRGSVARVALR